ncbi:hypothetical protein EW146_g5361 [Bondarzewia mesenterica]|uniref:Uncharacterized protein n=1 Tax=Bondarzewia mesenterica TaxID=1095465 RepID=A0A4S4LXH7_9AGAM|nr:hypothetical protein EW146_g5361 [Bondarzewia mesenterica]
MAETVTSLTTTEPPLHCYKLTLYCYLTHAGLNVQIIVFLLISLVNRGKVCGLSFSRLMPIDTTLYAGEENDWDENDWELLGNEWWRTSLSGVTWTYPHSRRRIRNMISLKGPKEPPYYHDTLLLTTSTSSRLRVCCDGCQEIRDVLCPCDLSGRTSEDVQLSPDLAGVTGAEAAVQRYELDVGFCATDETPPIGDVVPLARRVSLLRGDVPTIGLAQRDWQNHVQMIVGTVLTRLDDEDYSNAVALGARDVKHLPSILDLDLSSSDKQEPDIIDLTDSEQSVESEGPPVTPKYRRTYASAVSKNLADKLPKLHIPTVSFSSSISSSSPQLFDESLSESSYTRSSSLPPSVGHQKDDQGLEYFVNDVAKDDSTFLPTFLVNSSGRARKPHSRTREIVDRLRYSSSSRGRQLTRPNDDSEELAVSNVGRLTSETVRRLFQTDGWIPISADEHSGALSSSQGAAAIRHGEISVTTVDGVDAEDALIPFGSTIRGPPVPKKKVSGNNKSKHNRRPSNGDGWIDFTRPSASRPPPPTAPASVGRFTFPPPPVYSVMYPTVGFGMMHPYAAAPGFVPYGGVHHTYPNNAPYPAALPSFLPVPINGYPGLGYSSTAAAGGAGLRQTSW